MRPFHNPKTVYADHSITNATNRGKLTVDDARLIRDFIAEIKATKGIGAGRANKIIFTLVTWRNFLGPFQANTISDLYRGVEKLRESRQYNGAPYKQNTQRDFMLVIKRFYRWLNKKGFSSVPVDEIREIKAPRSDRMTKTAQMMLTEEEIRAMIEACQNSRDRAIISTLYEGGFRCEEIGRLTWGQVKFDEYGTIINVDEKTGSPRYVRLLAATPYLVQWKNDYPFTATPESLVFVSVQKFPLQYAAVAMQLKKIAKRAGIQKRITPHLLRHSRITEMIKKGYNESTVKKTMWGNINTTMFPTYLHLTDEDIDNEMLERQGIRRTGKSRSTAMDVRQCINCNTINAPTFEFCSVCGQPLTNNAQMGLEQLKRDIEATPEYKMIMNMVRQKLTAGA